jgi:glyoxylase-like metal-dependent hydrolase (beta-lactamase superfamily II)
MTELDLNALGIWWIPIPLLCGNGLAKANVWAIEDVDGGIALFDCGYESSASVDALTFGLAEAGASLDDVQRIILSHAHPEHCGAARWITNMSRRSVAVFASRQEARALRSAIDRVYVLQEPDSFFFRHFEATVLELPGHTPGLLGLFAEAEGFLFSSDHLVQDCPPGAMLGVSSGDPRSVAEALDEYQDSLTRVAKLDVRVVLPGRGAPFAGHRRVARESAAALRREPRCALPAAGHLAAAPAFGEDLRAVRGQLQQAQARHG